MPTIRARVAPWLPSRKVPVADVRPLVHADTEALRVLVARDHVANVFVESILDQVASAVPSQYGALILGYFDADTQQLEAACWVGSNVVPVEATPEHGVAFARWIGAHWKNHGSIFGPAEPVLALMEELKSFGIKAAEVRPCQPLMSLAAASSVSINRELKPSRADQFEPVLNAAAAMFEEEVGYSPFLGGAENYRRRVAWLIASGYSLSHTRSTDGTVIFKADLGAVTAHATQIQGVWLHPAYRGRGLSAGYMAAVVDQAHKFAPVASLYVNDYNVKARALYERVGFEQVGTFATVLL